jgi:excisionase family DNA binding protein
LPGAPDSRFRLFRKATSIGTLNPSSCRTQFKSTSHQGKDPSSYGAGHCPTAAARLGIGYSTLKQWIYQGRIRTTQTAGGHHRLAEAEIQRFLIHHTPDTQPNSRQKGTTRLIVALSGRNRLRGFLEEVRHQELKLRRGDQAVAIIKSTEVMIAREVEHANVSKNRARR